MAGSFPMVVLLGLIGALILIAAKNRTMSSALSERHGDMDDCMANLGKRTADIANLEKAKADLQADKDSRINLQAQVEKLNAEKSELSGKVRDAEKALREERNKVASLETEKGTLMKTIEDKDKELAAAKAAPAPAAVPEAKPAAPAAAA